MSNPTKDEILAFAEECRRREKNSPAAKQFAREMAAYRREYFKLRRLVRKLRHRKSRNS